MQYEQPKDDARLALKIVGGEANPSTIDRKRLSHCGAKGVNRLRLSNGKTSQRFFAPRLQPVVAPVVPIGFVRGNVGRRRGGDEGLLNLRVDLILGQLVEHLELLGLEVLDGGVLDERVVALEVVIQPAERVDLQLLRVLVRAGRNIESDFGARSL